MTLKPDLEKCQESDIDEVMEFVNETYQVETGDSGIGFKCVNRLTSREDALTYLSDLWILREAESGSIVGCVFAKLEAKEDGSPYVYIGLLAVKVGNQGRGIGSKILDIVELFAPVAQMVVAECRSDLIPFYMKRGYVKVGTRPILDVIPATSVTRPDLQMIVLEKQTGGKCS